MSGRLLAVNDIDLWVEEFGRADDPGLVLVPGGASASDWWDDEFCEALADGGYRVVRFDLRDTGQSTTRPLGEANYTGDDLVDDLAALIVELKLAPAHVVGLSLGGALTQRLAVARPELVASVTLMSTSPGGADAPDGDDRADEGDGPEVAESTAQPDLTDRESVFRSMLAEERLFAGTFPVDENRIRRISDRIFDRAIDLAAGANQWGVPPASGTRGQLADITAPTLVVHGTADPLFPIEHGEALAREIPDARLLRVPGLGHQFPPPETWELVVPAILEHADRAR